MKKSLLKMTFAAVAMFMASTASAEVTEPTLTQDWTTTENLPAAGSARYGAGFNGKIFVNEANTAMHCYEYDETTSSVKHSTVEGIVAPGHGMAFDDAGNAVIINKSMGSSPTAVVLWKSGTTETVSIDLSSAYTTLGATVGRMDYMGRGIGDIFSEKGGVFFFTMQNAKQVVKLHFVNGALDTDKSSVIDFSSAHNQHTIAVPLTSDVESDAVAVRNRSNKDFYYYNGTKWVAYTRKGNVSATAGGDIVRLGGDLYTIEPSGTNYMDGWQIVNRTTNTVVATVNETLTAATSGNVSALFAQKISDTKAYIYHYHPGGYATCYTFEVPAPAPLYVIGSCQGWDPSNGLEMTYADGVYTLENVEFTDDGNFGLTTVKSSDWNTVNASRYGFATDNDIAANNTTMDIVKGAGAIKVPFGGVYTITADINALTVKVSGKGKTPDPLPEELFVIGNLDDSGNWDPSNGIELTKVEDGVFTGEVELYEVHDQNGVGSGWAYFALATALGNNSDDWDTMNASPRFGAESTDHEIATPEGASLIMTETQNRSWKVLAHNETLFNITVNFNDMTVKLDSYTGVEDVEVVEEDVPAVYYNLQGIEVVNPAKGNIYIVKRGNKVTKELK